MGGSPQRFVASCFTLLKRGAYVENGTLWLQLSMWREADQLGRTVALIAALDAEMNAPMIGS